LRDCITDHRTQVRERVDEILFEYPAGSFFQNNNSVLPSLVDFVRNSISQPVQKIPATKEPQLRPTHLVDAYCGCGLFSLSLAKEVDKVVGIELSADSIASAKRNAELNKLTDKVEFRVGDASHIFDAVKDFPPSRTVVIVDPPRKGCGEDFLKQLLLFRCSIVVYVSCNVHTQARDVGFLLNQSHKDEHVGHYELVTLQGFDLFPQTAHVESVAVLRLVWFT
jgi:tRNA (uracil-5-)-methyltransferase